MRVLWICYEDPERILGGMGMHVRELGRSMAELEDVELHLLTDGEREGSDTYLGVRRHYSDKLVAWKPPKPDLGCLLALDLQMARTLTRLLAQGHRWDLVHVHEWNALQIGRMARDALGVPMVGTMHLCLTLLAQVENPGGSPATWRQGDLYMAQMEGHLVTDPQELVLCSDAYVEAIRRTFLTDRPINMIPNGINLAEWNPEAGDRARGREGILDLDAPMGHAVQPARPMALQVGRIATMKGIVPLLDALETRDTGWTVVLAGEVNANDDTEREAWNVTKRIRSLERAHPERLRWAGFRHGRQLRDLYAAADAVIMPSIHEPFGIVALEAMAMGAPLISTEVDGLGEIVAPDGGEEYALIIPPSSPEAILGALELARRPEVRAELRSQGLRRVRDYSWERAAERTREVYRRAIERHQEVRLCTSA